MKKPSKKEAQGEDETVEMLQEGEEEEIVDEDDPVEPQKGKLTKEALKNHNEFIRACKEGELTKAQFDLALESGDEKMVMRLWKAFEASRHASKADEEYKETTKGAGKDKKKAMLRSSCLDGGKCTKHYREQIQSMKLSKTDEDLISWLTQKQAVDTFGESELKETVKAGTIKMKKDPSDPRFYKFQLVEEKSSIKRQREWNSKMETRCQAKMDDMVLFENMMKEDLGWRTSSLCPWTMTRGATSRKIYLRRSLVARRKGGTNRVGVARSLVQTGTP